MSLRIGPTFAAELQAAGCAEGIAWLADGTLMFGAAVASGQQMAAQQVLAAHDPTKALPAIITGNQWAFALGDLGLAAAWRAGVAKSKDKDQVRAGLIDRITPLLVTDPLLVRIAANAGTDANGAVLIDVPTVFAKALTEPT